MLLQSREYVESGAVNLFEPETIRITDEANDLLVELAQVTGLGKSGLLDAAIRLLADKFIDSDINTLRLIQESKDNRSFAEHVNDVLVNAINNLPK